MSALTSADLAKVANRHPDIPQDAIFDRPDVAVVERVAKQPPIKSVKWKECPFHTPSGKRRLTGLIPGDGDELVFREHTKWIGSLAFTCPGSGSIWRDERR